MIFLAGLKDQINDMAYQAEMVSRRDKRSALLDKFQFIRNVKKQEAEKKRRSDEAALKNQEKEAVEEEKKQSKEDVKSPDFLSRKSSSAAIGTDELL